MSTYHLSIDIPSGKSPLVEYRRDFDVQGKICGDLKEDMILKICLYDEAGKLLRHVCSKQMNDENLYLDHPDLITYHEELDPGKIKLKQFGFPELLVKDLSDPEASLHDATIKCFCNSDSYKGVIVSASDTAHGRILESGLSLCDENGEAYDCLEMGTYLLEVSLSDREGNLLTKTEKKIVIGKREEAVIVRFNPPEHRKRMNKWCEQMGFTIINDTLPGYLEPYLGRWYYHMGLLKYYRSNDIAIYADALVHMFVYLCDPSSTSYETELAYLASRNRIGDRGWLRTYRYDIGEAAIGKGRSFERQGRIVPFEDALSICRIDLVDEEAKENIFDLSESRLLDSAYDLSDVKVKAGSRIAFHCIARPRQFDVSDCVLKDDNTYRIDNEIDKIVYRIDDREEERNLMMERIHEEGSIGFSVYEAYNIFELKNEDQGKTLQFTLTLKDRRGNLLEGRQSVSIKVI